MSTSTTRKRALADDSTEKSNKKKRLSTKGVSFYIPLNLHINNETSVPVVEETTFTQTEVTALLAKQEHYFRQLLEEKLKEQFNMFNQLYIENIFKEYIRLECPYIN